ncbi:hypothetical protein [Gordonibacter urolithinfaciens]|uniref:hypothetical protein n=1 Tax=Gordonibacter urolithinfaciens TaxID=1335613 RepID=UPI0036F2BE2B
MEDVLTQLTRQFLPQMTVAEKGRALRSLKALIDSELFDLAASEGAEDDPDRTCPWSFPKLKIPHQSHADFCSTDTAGGLDNKKRRYAPRGGVAYRLFLWRFPKGATPPFGTRLCEAKCSVLYALSALP